MIDDSMICYSFCFLDEDGQEIVKDIWAHFETEAWHKADEIAYRFGYTEYELLED